MLEMWTHIIQHRAAALQRDGGFLYVATGCDEALPRLPVAIIEPWRSHKVAARVGGWDISRVAGAVVGDHVAVRNPI